MPITGLVVPVSGPYTATWKGFTLGVQNDDGYVLTGTWQGQEVNQSDAFGMTLVEAIYRGINWRLRFRGLEFNKTGILNSMQAFGSTGEPSTTFTPTLGVVGTRASLYTQPLVLTSTLAVAPTGPAFISTLTALGAVIAPQTNIELMFTSKVREAPIEMILLPYSATVGSLTNQNIAFSTT